ncbi:unnamed protein product [Polarella glacialis]|uniref:Uncharacterized protein n=1 Tax=Polarella glacialis TaxID=89957 RepID=A0A813HL12_POLGL|nr:unnamed protein product [Polarella glacialis]
MADFLDDSINKNVFQIEGFDYVWCKVLPWHWNPRELGLAVSGSRLAAIGKKVFEASMNRLQKQRAQESERFVDEGAEAVHQVLEVLSGDNARDSPMDLKGQMLSAIQKMLKNQDIPPEPRKSKKFALSGTYDFDDVEEQDEPPDTARVLIQVPNETKPTGSTSRTIKGFDDLFQIQKEPSFHSTLHRLRCKGASNKQKQRRLEAISSPPKDSKSRSGSSKGAGVFSSNRADDVAAGFASDEDVKSVTSAAMTLETPGVSTMLPHESSREVPTELGEMSVSSLQEPSTSSVVLPSRPTGLKVPGTSGKKGSTSKAEHSAIPPHMHPEVEFADALLSTQKDARLRLRRKSDAAIESARQPSFSIGPPGVCPSKRSSMGDIEPAFAGEKDVPFSRITSPL